MTVQKKKHFRNGSGLNPSNPDRLHFPAWAALLVSIMANLPIIDMVFHKMPEMESLPAGIGKPLPEVALPGLVLQLIVTFFFCFFLILYLHKHQWRNGPTGNFAWILLLKVSAIFTFFFIVMAGLMLPTIHEFSWILTSVMTRGLLVLISSVFLTNYMKIQSNREKIFRENEALKELNLRNQIEVLRNQLNPHFFFNTLNTLSYLIGQDQQKSQLYLNKLSFVLRTTLELQQRDLIPLSEEIRLAEAYFHLLSIRFGGNVQMTFHGEDAAIYNVPPLTLQLLIENAVKHNVISTHLPLTIEVKIDTETQTLWVDNNLQPKDNTSGAGIGLKNLVERFRMLSGRNPEILSDHGHFTVKVPLLPIL